VSAEIIKSLAENNPILQLARRLPDMSRNQRRIPVTNALATAYFVAGDTGVKQTTELNWANRFIDAEELAVLVPIPEAVLDDTDYDIWAEVRPEIEKALGRAIFQAVAYGTNIPATWTVNLGGAGLAAICTTAGQNLLFTAYTDEYEAILGQTGAVPPVVGSFMAVEADGYGVSGSICHVSMKGRLRNVRDTMGQPIFKANMQDPTRYELDGTPCYFPTDNSVVAANSLMISGDWKQLVYAIRQDITYKVFTEGSITDNAGLTVLNLMQQDSVALRAVMRLGFALPNPINDMNAVAATRCPFAILT
jgi:HK97 family phage major capsid protein